MKIFMKHGDKELNVDTDVTVYLEDISEFVIKINKEVFGDSSHNETCSGHCSCHSNHSNQLAEQAPVQTPHRDDFSIRQRLPNNVVDISKLTIKEAIMESVLVRCPKCGQSHAIIIKDGGMLYLMRSSLDANEFVIVSKFSSDSCEGMLKRYCAEGDSIEQKLEYYYRVHSMIPLINKDFNISSDAEIFCPVCHQSSDFPSWKDAYTNKERYFEYEYICKACGGECVMDAQEEKDGKGLVICTKCGMKWTKEQL